VRTVLAVGYLSIDAIDTPHGRREDVPGGAALYAALGARKVGARAAIAARIGEDYPGLWLEALAALGIDIRAVERCPGQTRRVRLVHGCDGERRSGHDLDWWERTRALAPAPPILAGVDALVAGPMPATSLSAILDGAGGIPVVADTSEAFATRESVEILALLRRLAVFAPSREETRILLPALSDDDAARALACLGPHVLQKRGADGAFAVEGGGGPGQSVSAPIVERAVDPTGAGDAVVGALAARIAAGEPFLDAAAGALWVGALAVSGPGPSALGLDLNPILAERRRLA
jgi:ribokinase